MGAMKSQQVMAALLLFAIPCLACSPYENHSDEQLHDIAALFGLPFALQGRHPAPRLIPNDDGGLSLNFQAAVQSCTKGSVFDIKASDSEHERLGTVLIPLRRCSSADDWRVSEETQLEVSIEIPPRVTSRISIDTRVHLAFPPGSEFEMYQLEVPVPFSRASEWHSPTEGLPSTVRLYIHRTEPKLTNPSGPCSTMLEVMSGDDVESIKEIASTRLGITIASFRIDGGGSFSAADLEDGMLLEAIEYSVAKDPISEVMTTEEMGCLDEDNATIDESASASCQSIGTFSELEK